MNLLLPFTLILLQWSLDTKDPAVQQWIFALFLVVHVTLSVVCGVLIFVITRKQEPEDITYTDPFTHEVSTKPCWRYDLGWVGEIFFFKICVPGVMSFMMATRFGFCFPLLLQCWSNPQSFFNHELVKVHLRGFEATGSLARPWKQAGFVPEWISDIWYQTSEEQKRKEQNGGNATTKKSAKAKKK